jgi:hypothetical protein
MMASDGTEPSAGGLMHSMLLPSMPVFYLRIMITHLTHNSTCMEGSKLY